MVTTLWKSEFGKVVVQHLWELKFLTLVKNLDMMLSIALHQQKNLEKLTEDIYEETKANLKPLTDLGVVNLIKSHSLDIVGTYDR